MSPKRIKSVGRFSVDPNLARFHRLKNENDDENEHCQIKNNPGHP